MSIEQMQGAAPIATYHGFAATPPPPRGLRGIARKLPPLSRERVLAGVAGACLLGLALGFVSRPQLQPPAEPMQPVQTAAFTGGQLDIQVDTPPSAPVVIPVAAPRAPLEVLPAELARNAPRVVLQKVSAPAPAEWPPAVVDLQPADDPATPPPAEAGEP